MSMRRTLPRLAERGQSTALARRALLFEAQPAVMC